MQSIVQNFITEKQLFQKEDRLLLAVSGGMDSMVMVHLIRSLGYEIGVVHVNFKLRGEASDADEKLVRDWAKQNDIPFFTTFYDTKKYAATQKMSIQEAARSLRYGLFLQLAVRNNYKRVLTAHHLDDRLETFWLNFSRGTGWKGLVSLRASRGRYRRPLLCVNRKQIAEYQKKHLIPYREDESNASDVYRRNAFRHKVLPALYEWEPQLADRMVANFSRMEEMYVIYLAAIKKDLEELSEETEKGWNIDRLRLQQHPQRETVIWELLGHYGFTAEDCRQALVAKTGTILSTSNWQLLVQREQLILRAYEQAMTAEIYEWEQTKEQLLLPTGERLAKVIVARPNQFPSGKYTAMLSLRELVYPLSVRRWLPGDSFCPLGMNGKHQKLQDFFTNNKIDRFQRQQQWLLLNGNEQIIWVIGRRLDDRFKVREEDEEVLKIEFYRK